MAALTAMNPAMVSDGIMATVDLLVKGVATNIPWAAGQFLFVDTSGLAKACVTSAATVATSGGIKYYALTSQALGAAGTDTVVAEVGIITDDMEWEGNELDGDLAQGDIGLQTGINVTAASTTGSIVTVDESLTSYPHIEITNIGHLFDPAQYASTDTVAKVRFKVLPIALNAVRIA
jgi:hypothetical protein